MSLTSRRTAMARKRYKPEEIVAKLRQVDVLVSQGQNMVDAIRQIGVSEVTYYRWRQEFGGLKSEQVKRLKDLELENSRLRKAVSDLTLDKLILQEAARGGLAVGLDAALSIGGLGPEIIAALLLQPFGRERSRQWQGRAGLDDVLGSGGGAERGGDDRAHGESPQKKACEHLKSSTKQGQAGAMPSAPRSEGNT